MQKGFTLIEISIAISILAITVVGIFSAFFVVVILTSDSTDRLTGTYLAQEGIEIVRNIRDQNWLNMDDCLYNQGNQNCPTWLAGNLDSSSCRLNASGCQADYTDSSLESYVSNNYLNIDVNGLYRHESGKQSKFKRKIIIEPVVDIINTDTEHIIKVFVQVSWDKKGNILNSAGGTAGDCNPDNCITIIETLYNWYNDKYL